MPNPKNFGIGKKYKSEMNRGKKPTATINQKISLLSSYLWLKLEIIAKYVNIPAHPM
jgi:hypothetical protein